MTRRLIAVLALMLCATPALQAAEDHSKHMNMAGHGAPAAAFTDGVVKKVDKAGGKLTVAHGPIANLNMPAMTMAFRVKDPAWLGKLKEGAKIRFVAENLDGVFTITRLEAN